MRKRYTCKAQPCVPLRPSALTITRFDEEEHIVVNDHSSFANECIITPRHSAGRGPVRQCGHHSVLHLGTRKQSKAYAVLCMLMACIKHVFIYPFGYTI